MPWASESPITTTEPARPLPLVAGAAGARGVEVGGVTVSAWRGGGACGAAASSWARWTPGDEQRAEESDDGAAPVSA
jgi:hypothetical protein